MAKLDTKLYIQLHLLQRQNAVLNLALKGDAQKATGDAKNAVKDAVDKTADALKKPL